MRFEQGILAICKNGQMKSIYQRKKYPSSILASHDGIGLNPIRGIIDEAEILDLVASIEKEGALVNYKQNPDGSFSPTRLIQPILTP